MTLLFLASNVPVWAMHLLAFARFPLISMR